jgi:hypothetical protein
MLMEIKELFEIQILIFLLNPHMIYHYKQLQQIEKYILLEIDMVIQFNQLN